MAGSPLFSVVIPTYNRAAGAAAAVRSVLAQTDGDFECFAVDDGSTDGSVQALLRFDDPRLKVVANSVNRGQHACRNQAIREARGEWICFLDSDDLYLPERLRALREAIQDRPEAGFWFTNAYLHRFGRIVGTLFDPSRPIPEGKVPGWYAVGDEYLPYVTTMVAVRREAFRKTGFFREDLRILEDTELYARMFKDGLAVGVIRRPLAVRFLHEGQITREHERDFAESLEALAAGEPPADEARRIRLKVAAEVADYLWKSLKPTEARALLEAELGEEARGTWAYRKTFLPPPLLALARALRASWIKLRYHPAWAPREFREAGRVIRPFLPR